MVSPKLLEQRQWSEVSSFFAWLNAIKTTDKPWFLFIEIELNN